MTIFEPTAKSLLPEVTLDQWQQWSAGLHSKPVLLCALDGGRSNRSFLLDSDLGKLVFRVNGAGSLLPGAERHDEITIWRAASQRGIAPPLVFVDPRNRYLVSTYIDSGLPLHPQTNPAVIDHAFKLLEGCHQLNVNASQIDYFNHIEHYWQLIEAGNHPPDPSLVEQRQPMQQALESLIDSNTPTGLCHHDPVIQNFVGSPERLYLIDWEYAAIGLQIMDYAALATEWEIDDATMHRQTGIEPDLLTMARAIYTYLRALWQEIVV